jgi:hypothetical protein
MTSFRATNSTILDAVWFVTVAATAAFAAWKIIAFVASGVGWDDVLKSSNSGCLL